MLLPTRADAAPIRTVEPTPAMDRLKSLSGERYYSPVKAYQLRATAARREFTGGTTLTVRPDLSISGDLDLSGRHDHKLFASGNPTSLPGRK